MTVASDPAATSDNLDRRHRVVTRAEIAGAVGVAEQAVSNWARRYADFPKPVWLGRQVAYPTAEIAAWLDTRTSQSDNLREGESRGHTYGQRFRVAMGLPPTSPPAEDGAAVSPERWETLWAPLDELRKKSDNPEAYQAIALSLLCLQQTDPANWRAVSRDSGDTLTSVITTAVQAQPEHLQRAYALLNDASADAWGRFCITRTAQTLAALVRADTRSSRPGSDDRIPAAAAFDVLLDRFARARHRSPDEYLAPTQLAQLIAGIASPRPTDRIHDPCCSSGELLVAVAAQLAHDPLADPKPTISGRAMTDRTWRLATLNTSVHDVAADLGAGPPDDRNEIEVGPGLFDVILLNPPFNGNNWRLPVPRRDRPWAFGSPPEHNANYAWMQLAVEALAPGGRVVAVMPANAAITHNPREQIIRNAMIDQGVVRCVIELPDYLFRETTSPATIWVLGRADEPRPDILLMDAHGATQRDGQTHRLLTVTGCAEILDTYHQWMAGTPDRTASVRTVTATALTANRIREQGYDLRPTAYLRPTATTTTPAGRTPLDDLARLSYELSWLSSDAHQADTRLDEHLGRLRPWIH